MKKLFVCAMALAAFVSCSKDDVAQGPALDSANKTVQIQIKNMATRADSGVTAPGEADTEGGTTMKSANASELYVLFADKDGKVLEAKALTATGTTDESHDTDHSAQYVADKSNGTGEGLYTWHNVPWAVTQIAVVRTNATADASYFGTAAIGKNISDYEDLAKDEDFKYPNR